MAAGTKVQVVPFVFKQFFQTNGVDAASIITEIPLTKVAGWGPHLFGITAHSYLDQFSTNFRWKIVFYWSFDGINWSSAIDLFAWNSTGSGVIHAAYIDATKLGLHMRYAVVCSPATGTNREWGTVSVALAFDFKS